ncbi:Dirigent protein 25 [Stylosanthes scabra]|uniref:Dirigent protein n=1 Tax=Stylosanthes scabra TaxID=79078 RepID=A0ABU6WJ33_9FABA|nr:Dirigent protein 25 [Stylosanthes scabra]
MEKLVTLSMNSTILLLACIFIAFITSTTSTRILIADDEVGTPSIAPQEPADSVVSPVPPLVTPSPVAAAAATTTAPLDDNHHTLSFFMHEILGGSNPSARAVTGVVTNPALNAQVAFAKPNGANLPLNAGVPQNNNNAGLLNNNNLPFLTGLGGTTASVFNKNGNFGNNNNNGVGFSVGNVNQLPEGMTLEKLMFGTMTVFDDELTEGEELGSGLVGKAQGFYVASSVDGTSQVMAFTAKFEENGYADSISFFGVHQTQISESQLAIIGGTGKYLNVGGFATIKTFPVNSQQHNIDGIETLVQLTAYLVY